LDLGFDFLEGQWRLRHRIELVQIAAVARLLVPQEQDDAQSEHPRL
jgi:hypothetical protein